MCFSGSTLDSSSLVPGSIPAAGAARTGSSGAAAPAKERAGRQPPIARGRWRGALLHVAGHIFFSYTACVHMISFAAWVRMFSFATCVARRSCSTDPVGNAAANSPLHSSQQGVRRQST